jgi:hypothetical protein
MRRQDHDKPRSLLEDSVKSRAIFRYVAGVMVKKTEEQVGELVVGVPVVPIYEWMNCSLNRPGHQWHVKDRLCKLPRLGIASRRTIAQ